MIYFSIRNLKVFFKDKAAVFFSMLAVFIIIGLYALFLGDVWLDSMPGLPGVRFLMDSWIAAGLLAVSSVTTTMGAFGAMVEDRTRKINKDFAASPIKSSSLVGGYVCSAVVIGVIMSLVTLVLAEVYVLLGGGQLLPLGALLQVLGLILLSTLANGAMVFFIVSFFRSANAFSTMGTVLGTLIGFLTGIYLPVGNLPEAVQWVVKCFPTSHAAALFRQVMMEVPMEASFAGAPAEAVKSFEELMGLRYSFGETVASPWVSAAVLLLTALVFFGLTVLNMKRKKK